MKQLETLIQQSILEDAPTGDITVNSLFSTPTAAKANLVAKQAGIFYGSTIIQTIFNLYDKKATLTIYVQDGQKLKKGDLICSIVSTHHILLLIERTLLNLLQRLSGIATLTHTFVTTLNNPKIAICDTRKTTPGLRFLEKSAVKAGGGTNHRIGLSDMILIKENHLKVLEHSQRLNQLPILLQNAKQKSSDLLVEIEIEAIEQLTQLDLSLCDYIMLDNFSLSDLPAACASCRQLYPHAQIEISGNVTLDNIAQYKDFDIDRISIGALTHSVCALDISLLIT